MSGYKVKLDMFEGPLDLLLYLIKKDEVNIYDIPIAQVTQQYMEYIEMMKLLNLDVVGDFIVMAATLLQIKSRMLLPPDPSTEEKPEEDPRDELVRRLLEYKKFKEIADDLRSKEVARQDLFSRIVDQEKTKELKEDAKETYFEASLFDLISALTQVLKTVPREVFYEVMKEEFTVDKKIHDILHMLLDTSRILLVDLFKMSKSRLEIIVTFIAVLELIRLKEILVLQKRVFGDIEVVRNRVNIAANSEQDPSEENTEADTQEQPAEEQQKAEEIQQNQESPAPSQDQGQDNVDDGSKTQTAPDPGN
ncbi:MAG: segregation/condensation protein A [Candidatus Omnitrophota bacterium]